MLLLWLLLPFIHFPVHCMIYRLLGYFWKLREKRYLTATTTLLRCITKHVIRFCYMYIWFCSSIWFLFQLKKQRQWQIQKMENNIQRNGSGEADMDLMAKGPPPVPITKSTPSANNLGSNNVKKDKRMNSSRFNISKNRELTPLPRLTGKWTTKTLRHFNLYTKSDGFDIWQWHTLNMNFQISHDDLDFRYMQFWFLLQRCHRLNVKSFLHKNCDNVVFCSISRNR